jgi:signal transduction histidine kinase
MDEQEFADRIAKAFEGYEAKNRQVVALYADDRPEQAKQLWLEQALAHYDRVYSLCESLSNASARDMEKATAVRHAEVKRMNLWVFTSLAVLASLVLGLFLSLSRRLFQPLRHLVDSLGKEHVPACSGSPVEEIRSLGTYIDSLRGEVAEMRSRLSASQRRLLDAEKLASVGKLAASVAHEIRSPLTSLRLRVFSVQRALGDSHRQRDFQLISEEITRLDSIVGSFLEFSRPRDPAPQRCDIHALLDRTAELLAYKLEATNVSIERQDDPSLPEVFADPQQMKQVLMNLLNNAIEALRGGGKIHLATCCGKDAKGLDIVRVLVQDSGPGIPREVQESIFDPFFGTKEEGTGLGLWIARRIMTEHGGGIDLKQSTASGTTFSLWLPVGQGNRDE